jgi:heat shock protein HtpX
MFNTLVMLGTLTVILLAVGWLIGGIVGMGVALALAIVINFVSFWYSDKLVLKLYKAQPLDNDKIKKKVNHLAKEAKIPTPRLYLVKSRIMNAFAVGRSHKQSAIAVTEGLLELEDDELEGVLAHEVAHIKNRDTLIGVMAATIAGAISFLAQIGYISLFFGGDDRGEGSLFGLILIIVFAPIAALLVRLAISRKREYGADWTGSCLTKKPEALASALRKISQRTRSYPIRGNSATSHLWIVNPFKPDWFTTLFSTHPPVEKRIERLEVERVNE